MTMVQIGVTPRGGVCRLALTDVDRQGRDLFVRWACETGCTVDIDQMGNIIAQRAGLDNSLPPVMTGSHLDSQPTGGKFDGAYGVLAGLEVIRTLNDHGHVTRHPIEVVEWTAGTRPCGGQPVQAYFEAHIEQGPILAAQKQVIGVVQGIQGLRWFDCTIHGLESHAGTTPIPTRRDAPYTHCRRPCMCRDGFTRWIWSAPPAAFAAEGIDAVRRAAQRPDLPHMDLISGAGHDAKYLTQVCPTAMIFIPCKDGISHNEIEDATSDDAAGCNVLLQARLEKAGS